MPIFFSDTSKIGTFQPIAQRAGLLIETKPTSFVPTSIRQYMLTLLTGFVCLFGTSAKLVADSTDNYEPYHRAIIDAETAIANQNYAAALARYRWVFGHYTFVFRRDYQVATQLDWQLSRTDEAFSLLKKGIASGWTRKSIRKVKFLKSLQHHKQWKLISKQYDSLRNIGQKRIDTETRDMVQVLFRQDQWKALGALFRFGETARNRYALRRFAPQSERHLAVLRQIIRTKGYPGEQLIGNNYWAETILSHHNSMTVDYTRRDTLYPQLKPLLLRAVKAGQMAPSEFARIDNWAISVKSDPKERSYGYLAPLTPADLIRADELRLAIGLRSVAVRNRLVDVQQKTGMDFFLPGRPQLNGKITVLEN